MGGKTGHRPEPDYLAMIRSLRFKLVHFGDGEQGQLFDYDHDPGETINLWDVPNYRDVRLRLTERLLYWSYSSQYKHRDLFRDSV